MVDLTGSAYPRPTRIAFLVEDGDDFDRVLDGIFADCYDRWGGRFSLIAPCVDGCVSAPYWSWLEAFDPDLIYSYVPLGRQEVLKVHERLYPESITFTIVEGTYFPLKMADPVWICIALSRITLSSLSLRSRPFLGWPDIAQRLVEEARLGSLTSGREERLPLGS